MDEAAAGNAVRTEIAATAWTGSRRSRPYNHGDVQQRIFPMNKPSPATPAICREQALAAWQRGDMAIAEQAFLHLLEVQPDDAEALQFLATRQLGRGQMEHAIELLFAAHRAQPQDAAILHRLGEVQMLAGDLEAAADAVIRGGYYASGQACISVQRVVVVEAVRDAFLGALSARIGDVVVGDPRSPETRVSALIDERSTERVRAWVQSAVSAGATLVRGGDVREGVVAPTVLLDVPDGQLAWDEEVFGPVVAVRSVASVGEAFEVVNRSRYGLHASVFTSSLATAFEAVGRLDVGGVVVNEVPGFRSDVMPYGGTKDSGIGREGPRFAIEELTVTRMAIIRPRP